MLTFQNLRQWAICGALHGASGCAWSPPANTGPVLSFAEMETQLAANNGFREELWREEAFYAHNFVLRYVVEQFPEVRQGLQGSGGKTLVYCVHEDAVWGIGRALSDPARLLPSRWGGKNELGKSLMAVREELSGGAPCVPAKKLQFFKQLLE
eukprot:Tamp_36386.p1 GENE.Tamp_36386~~Tamp_36386.p1  ORF type:complete len:153 (-),score=31.14 Tamp_36386:43-501(-)